MYANIFQIVLPLHKYMKKVSQKHFLTIIQKKKDKYTLHSLIIIKVLTLYTFIYYFYYIIFLIINFRHLIFKIFH